MITWTEYDHVEDVNISNRDHVVTGFQHLQPRLVHQVGHLSEEKKSMSKLDAHINMQYSTPVR